MVSNLIWAQEKADEDDPFKLKLKDDIEEAWYAGQQHFQENYTTITGAEFYAYTKELAGKFGWEFGNIHSGHLIGNFPHEEVLGDEIIHYIHPQNDTRMSAPDKFGHKRYWIYEIHFIDPVRKIGGFFEQLVSPAD